METKARFSIRPPAFFHFAWSSRHKVQLILPLCFFLAALFHIGVLFLFDVVYPPGKSPRPRPAEIAILSPGTPEYEKITNWLEANDPALLSASQSSDSDFEPLLKTPYRPTFNSATIHLQPAPPLHIPKPTGAVILPQDIVVIPESEGHSQPPQPWLPTQLEFRGNILPQTAPLPPPPNATQSAEPAEFSIGVLPDGKIGFIFLLKKGSGSSELDQKATEYLQNLQLQKNASGKIRWGVVVFHWGVAAPGDKKP
ncbi:MAG: hypothetical protein ABIP97_06390 [Chthoniobacterales bacterium]